RRGLRRHPADRRAAGPRRPGSLQLRVFHAARAGLRADGPAGDRGVPGPVRAVGASHPAGGRHGTAGRWLRHPGPGGAHRAPERARGGAVTAAVASARADAAGLARPSPWITPFAVRTYLAAACWLAGMLWSGFTETPDAAGWLAFRRAPPGLLYTAAALIGGSNFFGAGVRAAGRFRLDMNFLMSVAIVAALMIGEAFEAATLATL